MRVGFGLKMTPSSIEPSAITTGPASADPDPAISSCRKSPALPGSSFDGRVCSRIRR